MITRNMEMQLLKMGFGAEEINKLTPQEAWDIIEGKNGGENKTSPADPSGEERERVFLETIKAQEEAKLSGASPSQKDKIRERIKKIEKEIEQRGVKSMPTTAAHDPVPEIRKVHEEAIKKELLNKYNRPDQAKSFSDPSLEQKNIFILSRPEFASDKFNLGTEKIIQLFKIEQENIRSVFGNNSAGIWEQLKNIPAKKAIEQTEGNNATIRMAKYLQTLARFSKAEPESTLIKTESTEAFVARTLQKISAEGNLEILERDLALLK